MRSAVQELAAAGDRCPDLPAAEEEEERVRCRDLPEAEEAADVLR